MYSKKLCRYVSKTTITLFIIISIVITLPTWASDFQYTYHNQRLGYKIIDEELKTVEVCAGQNVNTPGIIISGNLDIPSYAKRVRKVSFYDENGNYHEKTEEINYKVVSIGDYAFSGNTLHEILLPNTIEHIGEYAFYKVGSVNIPSSVISIARYAYSHSGIKNAEFPKSIDIIEQGAFQHCISLEKIIIPISVDTIEDEAFSQCFYLTSVEIPSSVTSIGSKAFFECSRLKSVRVNNINTWARTKFEDEYSNPLSYAHYLYLGDNTQCISRLLIEGSEPISDYAFAGAFIKRIKIKDCPPVGKQSFWNANINYLFFDSTELGSLAFGTDNDSQILPAIYINQDNPITITNQFQNRIGATAISVPIGCKEKYIENAFWGQYQEKISETDMSSLDYFFEPDYENQEIEILAKSIKITPNGPITLNLGQDTTLYAQITPSSVTSKRVSWTSNDPRIAAVSDSGIVTAISEGETAIAAKTLDGSNKYDEIVVQVIVPVYAESIEISPKGPISLNIGESVQLNAKVLPDNVTDKTVSWLSQSECVSVSQDGLITGVSLVESNWITATNSAGQTDTVYVSIKPTVVQSIEVGDSIITMKVGESKTLTAKVLPENAADKRVRWSVLNDDIASITNSNVLTALSAGETTIFVTALDGSGIKSKITVRVLPLVQGDTYSIDDFTFTIISEEKNELSLTATSENISGGITIPSSLNIGFTEYSVTAIGDKAFQGRNNVTIISMSPNIRSIGDYAFQYCYGLSRINIPSSVVSIGKFAFYNCTGLTSINIPYSIKNIGAQAFYGCSNLNSVKADNVNAWARISFDSKYSNPLYYAGNLYVGKSSKPVENLVIEGTEPINNYAFYGTTCLKRVRVIQAESIGEDAFGATNITELCLNTPAIENSAFGNCKSLQNVYVMSNTPPTAPDDLFRTYYNSIKLFVPESCSLTYKNATSCWNKFPIITETDFDNIDELFFPDYENIAIVAEKLSLSQTSVNMQIGETIQLKATITPETTVNKYLLWETSDESIVTVEQNGIVHAIGVGECDIIVKTQDGSDLMAICKITVTDTLIEGVIVKIVASGTTTLKDGETVRLYAEVYPETATDKSIVWHSDNEAIATVEDGLVTAHSQLGVAHITATASSGVKGEIDIEVIETPVTEVTFVYTQLHLFEGQTEAMEVEFYPENATNKTLAWSVSDESILSVDDNGVITALKSGKAYVFAVANNDVYASLPIIVDKPIERIELESNYTVPLYTDDYGQIFISELKLEPKIYPDDAYVKNLKWTSSNESVGKVISSDNKNYTFYAYKPGKTTLTCKVTDGSDVTATCEVEVILFSEEIAFSMDGHVLERESTVYVKSGETVLINVTFYLKPTNPRYDDPTMNFSSDIIEVTELSQEPLDSFVSGYKRRYAVKGLSVGETAFVFFAYNTAGRIWIDVTDNSGIEQPEVDESLVRPIYYDLQGNKISGMNLLPGIYIKKTGPTIEKVFIR